MGTLYFRPIYREILLHSQDQAADSISRYKGGLWSRLCYSQLDSKKQEQLHHAIHPPTSTLAAEEGSEGEEERGLIVRRDDW